MERTKKRIFNILFISVFAAMLGLGIVSPLMPIFAKDLGANGIWLGIIFSGFSLSRGIFMPIIGKISDRKGRKKFITLGLFLYSIISLLYLLAYDVYSLTAIRIIHGFASAMVIPIAMAYVGETTKEGKEGSSMGTFNVALFLGMGAGPFLGGILNDSFGISSVFYAMFCLTVSSFLITLFLLPDINYSDEVKTKKSVPFRKIIKSDIIKGLLLFRAIGAIGRGGVMSFLPIFASRIHITPSRVGTIISVNIFLTALLQGAFGKLADRYNKFYLVLIGSTIGALALLCVPFACNFWALLLISSLMGLGGAISMPAATAITVKVGQKVGMGTSMGVFNTAMSIGMILAPLISGVVMDTLGLTSIFYVAGTISLLGTSIFYHYIKVGLKKAETLI